MNRDRKLNLREFTLAMWLLDNAAKKVLPPPQLPPHVHTEVLTGFPPGAAPAAAAAAAGLPETSLATQAGAAAAAATSGAGGAPVPASPAAAVAVPWAISDRERIQNEAVYQRLNPNKADAVSGTPCRSRP